MLKYEFLELLQEKLSGLPQEDIDGHVEFYAEMIDDRIEDGMAEEDAVAALGTVNDIIDDILKDVPLKVLVKEKKKKSRKLKAWEIVLLVIGSPLWVPLLLAAAIIMLAVYIVIWSVVISLWAVGAAFAACAVAGPVYAVVCLVLKNYIVAMAVFGLGVCCAGLGIFMFFACKALSRLTVLLAKKTALGIKKIFVGKEKGE